jgi:hypothetical protein
MSAIPQWTVKAPHAVGERLFEDEARAWAHARMEAGAAAPSVITEPPERGGVYFVFRAAEEVEVSTRHRFAGTTRRVVEP